MYLHLHKYPASLVPYQRVELVLADKPLDKVEQDQEHDIDVRHVMDISNCGSHFSLLPPTDRGHLLLGWREIRR